MNQNFSIQLTSFYTHFAGNHSSLTRIKLFQHPFHGKRPQYIARSLPFNTLLMGNEPRNHGFSTPTPWETSLLIIGFLFNTHFAGNGTNLIATQAYLFKIFNTHSKGNYFSKPNCFLSIFYTFNTRSMGVVPVASHPPSNLLSTPTLWETCSPRLRGSPCAAGPFNTHSMGNHALLPGFPLLWPLLPHLFFRLEIFMG
jgi:hypothetical protein